MTKRDFAVANITLQLRTRDNLLELLASGQSHACVVGADSESRITHVQIVNFGGTQMIEGVYDRAASHRREDGRLVVAFRDAHIVNCRVAFDGQNPVRLIEQ
jgi:hypothetical protein